MPTLLFHHGALGDSVLLWPILRALDDVTLVAPWSKAKLAARWLPNVTALNADSPTFNRLFATNPQPAPRQLCPLLPEEGIQGWSLPDRLPAPDRIITFLSNGHDTWAQNAARLFPNARFDFLSTKPTPGSSEKSPPPWGGDKGVGLNTGPSDHILNTWAHQLNLTPIQPLARKSPWRPPRKVNVESILIHPGSGGVHKCWPPDRFDALITRLLDTGQPITILWGEVEQERIEPVWKRNWQSRCNLVEPKDYVELSLCLSNSSLYIGNDSGPTHLAAQLGVNTLALFGPTDPRIWAPTGPQVRILAPPNPAPMTWLDVETVLAAI